MKKFYIFICSLFLFSAVGCQNAMNVFSSDVSSQSNSSFYIWEEGMSDWKYYYRFVEPDSYQEFYQIFTCNNKERYWMPRAECDTYFDSVLYRFHAKGADIENLNNNGYSTDFSQEQIVSFHFSKSEYSNAKLAYAEEDSCPGGVFDKGVTVSGRCYDISTYTFDFAKEKMTLVCTQKQQHDQWYYRLYQICIGETVLCDIELSLQKMDVETYEQIIGGWTKIDNYMI